MTANDSYTTFVLVRAAREGNIGAAARAIKTMGFDRLVLVDPQTEISSEAYALAHGSADVLDAMRVYPTLPQALQGHDLVIGTTTRRGHDRQTPVRLRRFVEHVLPQYPARRLAVVFGSETAGLSNEDLEHCQFAVEIPTGTLFHSLNLSHAVQTVAYELFESRREQLHREGRRLAEPLAEVGSNAASPSSHAPAAPSRPDPDLAEDAYIHRDVSADETTRAYRLEQLARGTGEFLSEVGYPHQTSVARAVSDLRRVLGSTYLTQRDVNTVLGCYRHIRYRLRLAGSASAPAVEPGLPSDAPSLNQPPQPGRA
jgi:TrmH family RNA methyltransferase